jgi:NitT/TauT family transport system permease protein
MKTKYYLFLGPILFLVFWELICLFNIVDTFFLPAPYNVIIELFRLFRLNEIYKDILTTLFRFLIAIALGIIFGITLGIILGINKKIYKSSEFLIDFFRSIPISALFPLFLLLLGVGDGSKIGATVFSSTIIIAFTTSNSIIQSKLTRIFALRMMGATKYQLFKHVLFWENLPQIIIGIRTATSIALMVIIITEMFIGTNVGIGHRIISFQYIYNVPGIYAMIIIAGIIGFTINFGFAQIEKRLIHWSGK